MMNRKNKSVLGFRFRASSAKDARRSFAHNPQLATRNPTARRGILLLVVLSMLTLFLLIGTTYIVTADHFRKSERAMMKATETSNSSLDQGDLINEVLNQVLRDTSNPHSTLRFHSLLRDMYGNDAVMGSVNVAEWASLDPGNSDPLISNPTNGQIFQFTLNLDPVSNRFITNQHGIPSALRNLNNAYNGLVLTFLDGPVRGQSTRIVGFLAGTNPVFRVQSVRKANGQTLTNTDFSQLSGARILINGRPFNGTGFGYSRVAPVGNARLIASESLYGNADVSEASSYFPTALMPNSSFLNPQHLRVADYLGPGIASGTTQQEVWGNLNDSQRLALQNYHLGGLGGSDESYDAPDFQNMLLALLPDNSGGPILPSLHRPALINYWRTRLFVGNGVNRRFNPLMLRKVMMRPSWLDHPNFTGSNPEFANLLATYEQLKGTSDGPAWVQAQNKLLYSMIYGSSPWDVDNDNDGYRDSVWVDFGAPVVMNSDGRLVKPMAALLIVDMDGRLNLNAHSSGDIASGKDFYDFWDGGNPAEQSLADQLELAGDSVTTDDIAQGQGYGPAEISLAPLMPGTSSNAKWPWYKRLFEGANDGDYRVANETKSDNPTVRGRKFFLRRRAGKYGGNDSDFLTPGRIGFDLGSQLKMQGAPSRDRWFDDPNLPELSNYVTPPDFKGRYALGLNRFGQPVYEAKVDLLAGGASNFDISSQSLMMDSPYEVDLSLQASRGENMTSDDTSYSVAELERVLRAYDADAGSLSPRLWDLAGGFKRGTYAAETSLGDLNKWRTSVTTDSYDLPVPSVAVPAWMLVGADGVANTDDDFVAVMDMPVGSVSFADLLEYRIRVELGILNPNVLNPNHAAYDANTANTVRREMNKLLPADLANGLRLDINRPFGNGRDDNGNRVVDEPGEDEGSFWASTDTRLDAFTGNDGNAYGWYRDDALFLRDLPKDFNGDGDENVDDFIDFKMSRGIDGAIDTFEERFLVHNLRRQMLARDLYVMAMTLTDPFDLTNQEGKKKARKLAQWAINVCDFRDPDNIMTAFEYDVNPFDGWAVDGNTNKFDDWAGTDVKPNTNDDLGGVVWGAGSPELLLTETLAWHDRSTENHGDEDPANDEDGDGNINQDDRGTVPRTAPGGAGTKVPDSDFDQRFLPQGAGFIELYCPLPENAATNADTHLKDGDGNDLGINLSALDHLTGTSPVWRISVYKTNGAGNAGPGKNPDSRDFADIPKTVDRTIYFTGDDPEAYKRPDSSYRTPDGSAPEWGNRWDDDGVAFYSTLNVPTVRPGRYMVVGGTEGNAGSYTASLGCEVGQTEFAPYGLELDSDATAVNRGAAVRLTQKNGAPLFSVSAGVTSVALLNEPRRFSFSEPAQGYPNRVEGSTKVPGPHGRFIYQPILDVPIDDQRGGAAINRGLAGGGNGKGGGLAGRKKAGRQAFQDNETRLMLPPPNAAGGGLGGGGGGGGAAGIGGLDPTKAGRTIPGFSWVYLQRLANPMLPWNPAPVDANGVDDPKHDDTLTVNPYVTIDSMGVNVTVFNGMVTEELHVNTTGKGNSIYRFTNTQAGVFFSSLERGTSNVPGEPSLDLNQMQDYAMNRPSAAIQGQIQNLAAPAAGLESNLLSPEPVGYTAQGMVGLSINNMNQNTDSNFRANPNCSLGFLNTPFEDAGLADVGLEGEKKQLQPKSPFPWYTWNNRPFANANELLLVPAFQTSQLLTAFSMRKDPNQLEAYNEDIEELQISETGVFEVDGMYSHLLNFFRTDSSGADKRLLTADDQGIAGMHRLLDYVQVPSPFVGTEEWLNPVSFGSSTVTSVNDPRFGLQPPFNKVSNFRDPGRVNLNTMGQTAYMGLMHADSIDDIKPEGSLGTHPGPDWSSLVTSRRGYGGGPVPLQLGPSSPTFFANPFRSGTGGDLVPLNSMILMSDRKNTDVHGSMLRGVISRRNLVGKGLFAAETDDEFNDSDRNPYFRYQPMTRLSSMTTTRSNVYAIWITIGFFEVEAAPTKDQFASANGLTAGSAEALALYEQVYPEGYQLGKEAGSDTGNIRRVREFAIVDRTIPVAFEPGKNHNVDKAVRLRRRIE